MKSLENILKPKTENEILKNLSKLSQHELNDKLMHYSITGGRNDISELLIKAGANVNIKYKSGYSILMYTSMFGNKDLAQILINNGADVNQKDASGWTALMIAVNKSYIDIVKILINNGADVNAKIKAVNCYYTVLDMAKERRSIDILKILQNKITN